LISLAICLRLTLGEPKAPLGFGFMSVSDAELQRLQHEVQRLIGQCLLNLQQYELLMKNILARHAYAGPVASFEEGQAARAAEVSTQTMGTLMKQLLGSFLVPIGQEGGAVECEVASSVSFRMQVSLPPEDFARTFDDLREFVSLRNNLVHHFAAQHVLARIEGCNGAIAALTVASDRIDRAMDQLCTWAEDLVRTQSHVAEVLLSPGVLDAMVAGRFPWHMTSIVQALQAAEDRFAVDGWTPLATAVDSILKQNPDELPERHDCRTWPHLIHESRLFDLQYQKKGARRVAIYRGRSPAPVVS
jgi:hypothetical protein